MSFTLGNPIAVSTNFIKSNPAVPVYKGTEEPENLFGVIYHIEIGYNENNKEKIKQYGRYKEISSYYTRVRALVDFAILADSAALYECRKIIEIFIYVCYNTDIYEYVGIGNIINIGVI